MRVLYIDIDSLRADHVGCYGYGRATTPNIDRVARDGLTFSRCYASDLPCAPSRSAMFSGCFGARNGVVSHYGRRSDPYMEFEERTMRHSPAVSTALPAVMRDAGMMTATVSPFAARHSLYTFLAGFRQSFDPGGNGHGDGADVTDLARRWLRDNGRSEDWFLHVNYWDPHIPYRLPSDLNPGWSPDLPDPWLSAERFEEYAGRPGHRSFLDTFALRNIKAEPPFQPGSIESFDEYRAMIDSYDLAIRYTDIQVGLLLRALEDLGILQETAVIIAADHGEDMGEMGSIGHGLASEYTARVPMVMRWPGVTDGPEDRIDGLCYHFDIAATVLDLLGFSIPVRWDGRSLVSVLTGGGAGGRDHLVISHLAQSIQRSVRYQTGDRELLYTRNTMDMFHCYPEATLHDLAVDPHCEVDLLVDDPALAENAQGMLDRWVADLDTPDPIDIVREDACKHYSRQLQPYLQRLASTGRAQWSASVSGSLERLLK